MQQGLDRKIGGNVGQLVKHDVCSGTKLKIPRDWKKLLQYISWGKPNQGWVKLNVDEASKHNLGRASVGRLIRNEYGQWIVGFITNLGHASNVAAGLWAIHMGLRSAWNSGYRKIVIESKSKVVVSLLESALKESLHWNIIVEIRDMLSWN